MCAYVSVSRCWALISGVNRNNLADVEREKVAFVGSNSELNAGSLWGV